MPLIEGTPSFRPSERSAVSEVHWLPFSQAPSPEDLAAEMNVGPCPQSDIWAAGNGFDNEFPVAKRLPDLIREDEGGRKTG